MHDLSLILNHYMFVKLPSEWFYQIWTNSSIEDNVKAVGLQVNVSSPISNLVLRLVKIISGVKIHTIWRLILRLVKYSLELNTNY